LIPVHRNILCARSATFYELFKNKNICLPLKDISLETLLEILSFCYTGTCNISKSNGLALMMQANRFQLHDLVVQCIDFLRKTTVSSSDKMSLLSQIDSFTNPPVLEKLNKHVVKELLEICLSMNK